MKLDPCSWACNVEYMTFIFKTVMCTGQPAQIDPVFVGLPPPPPRVDFMNDICWSSQQMKDACSQECFRFLISYYFSDNFNDAVKLHTPGHGYCLRGHVQLIFFFNLVQIMTV